MTVARANLRALDDRAERWPRVILLLVIIVAHLGVLLFYVDAQRKDEIFVPQSATAPQVQTFRPAAPPPPMRPERPQRERRELAPIPELEIDLTEPETQSEPLTPPPLVQLPLDFIGEVSAPAIAVGATAPGIQAPLNPGAAGLVLPVIIEKTKVNPRYPDAARNQRVNGQVVLMCVATRRGDIADCRVVHEAPQGVGFAQEATAVVVGQWKCVPGRRNGEPVDVYMTITVTFSLGF